MPTGPTESARQSRKALGARLRQLRKDAGLSARTLATLTDQHFTRLSKIENGVQPPTPDDLRAWSLACDAETELPDLLATLRAVESAYLEFRQQSRAGMKQVLGAHTMARYQKTTTFRIYEHNVIPGLFQTKEYSLAMLSFWIDFLDTPNDLEGAVRIRQDRQIVVGKGNKRFSVLIEEQALRTWFGTAEMQAGQLGRLLELMTLPNVALGVIPLMRERTAVASAGFWMFDDVLVALETPTANIEVSQPREIELYAKMFEALRESAVYGVAARDLIVRVLQELSR